MKTTVKLIFTVYILLLIANIVLAQQPSTNYYMGIKKHDLSKVWRGSKLHLEGGSGDIIDFPEPIGFIGNDYHRFYIHYITVEKDKVNPYKYLVSGKTRVNNNVCSFTGSIIIVKAILFKESDDPRYKEGEVICTVDFKEDSTQRNAGFFHGRLTTDWYINKQGQLFYDTINSVGDGFCNNQCEATWTSYTSHKSKKCNWGDYRIPASNELDSGAGDFVVNEKYINNGWLNYVNMYNKNNNIAKKAINEENREWWQ